MCETGSIECSSADDGKLDKADHRFGLYVINPAGSYEQAGFMFFGHLVRECRSIGMLEKANCRWKPRHLRVPFGIAQSWILYA